MNSEGFKKSRVYLRNDGSPEFNRFDLYEKQEQERIGPKSPELLEALRKIDFSLLKVIFAEHIVRSGMSYAGMNFLPSKRIKELSRSEVDKTHKGVYDFAANIIIFYKDRIIEMAKSTGLSFDLCVLYLLVHEEGHAISKTICQGFYEKDGQVKVGYSEMKQKSQEELPQISYLMFEEGVNELLTISVLEEYLDRQDNLGNEETFALRKILEKINPDFSRYVLQVNFVKELVIRLSKETDLSPETIWQAILRGKIEGASLHDEEIRREFAEVFGSDFLDKLSRINQIDQVDELSQLMNEVMGENHDSSHPNFPFLDSEIKKWAEKSSAS